MATLMKKALLSLAAFTAVGLGSSVASADIVFAPSVYLQTEKVQVNGGTSSDNRYLVVDFRLGYVFPENGLYIGGLYKMENDAYSNGDLKGYAAGPSIGYVNGAFSFIATYHVMAEKKYTFSGVETKYASGSGWQLDLSYAPQVSPNFGLGPILSYRDIKYSKTQVGGAAETSNTYEISGLTPGIMFYFNF